MSPPYSEDIERVTPATIREIFNKSQYPRWIDNGTLTPNYIRNNHLSQPELVNEPVCTHSQVIRYCDSNGNWLVEVHQYFHSGDNTIGGSGRPDPKRLRIGYRILIADKHVT